MSKYVPSSHLLSTRGASSRCLVLAVARDCAQSCAVVSGGAFHYLMVDHEGYDMAHWLTQLGVTAFVLKYRLARTPDNDADMPAFAKHLESILPHPGLTE